MIKYYCNTCGEQVRSLGDLSDLRSQSSLMPTAGRFSFDGNFQEHVCKNCIHAIKHFITTLRAKKAPPKTEGHEISAQVQ